MIIHLKFSSIISWTLDGMEQISHKIILPLDLQRRINRLVSIEDILKEVPISSEDKQLNDAEVSNKFALFIEQ